MALDLTAKRVNWIGTGLTLLFGSLRAPAQPASGFYAQTIALQAWVSEGILAGFLPNAQNQTASPILDTDFAAYPNINASVFMAAVGALQTLNTDYAAVVAALVAIKP